MKRSMAVIFALLIIFGLSGCNTDNGQSTNKKTSNVDIETELTNEAMKVITALKNKNMEELSTYVHPVKGLLFSPYSFIDTNTLVFKKDEIPPLLYDVNKYVWGLEHGSGLPINLTFSQYFERFVFDKDYTISSEVTFDQDVQRGNMNKNIKEMYSDAHVVEYYHEGTGDNKEFSWSSLNVVFQKDAENRWRLVALVHDQWTI
ncbi:hypothetical protein [Bacillus solimangrovi]|uniref:Lipoprotein n=1 Tax=Bacillus solimangrovi TaxID=1305675 RepID=A0A1E5LBU9_9BACI|nr:hypothetical protein [Bacillus solimangrovi]OEH91560.1 hypothetical protein BFG57_04075 [Bacillus solimangrovi]